MGHYHFSYKAKGRGYAQAHANYICREGKYNKLKDGEALVHVAHGNMPKWAKGKPIEFFKAADNYERSNGNTYREFQVAVSNKLTYKEQIELIDSFVKEWLGDDFPYLYALHDKNAALDNKQKQPHAHIMFSERQLDGIERSPEHFFKRANSKVPANGGCKKNTQWHERKTLMSLRKSWEVFQNEYFARKGIDDRVDCRSLKDMYKEALIQGDDAKAALFDRVSTKKIGPKLLNMKESEVIKDTEAYIKISAAYEYQAHKKMLEEIYAVQSRYNLLVNSLMTVGQAKSNLKKIQDDNLEAIKQTEQYIESIKYRKNAIQRQYSTSVLASSIYKDFSSEYKPCKNDIRNAERRKRNILGKIADFEQGKTDKLPDGYRSLEELNMKLENVKDTIEKLEEKEKAIVREINSRITPEQLKDKSIAMIKRLNGRMSRLDQLHKELDARLLDLGKEREDIRKANTFLWNKGSRRIVSMFRTNQRNNYVEMGATGTRLHVQLYDERELAR